MVMHNNYLTEVRNVICVCFPCRRLVQSRPELVDRFIAMNCPHSKLVNLLLQTWLPVLISFRVYRKVFSSNYRQLLFSWVSE